MPEYDLLMNADQTVYAVNCRVEGTTLHCGALYLEPLIPHHSIRLAYGDAIVDVDIPPEFVNQGSPYRAWEIELPIQNE